MAHKVNKRPKDDSSDDEQPNSEQKTNSGDLYRGSNRFSKRIIAITGAYGGFGREMVKRITCEGGKVIAIGDVEQLKNIQKQYSCHIVVADLAVISDQKKVIQALIDLHADALVNNAGIFIEGDCAEFKRDSYNKIMKVNLEAPLFISQGIANHWAHSNNSQTQLPKHYNIVNISSCASLSPLKCHILYGLSKAGLDYITKHMALEYGSDHIQINSVNPTVINSEMGTGPRGYWGNALRRKWALDRIPMGRFGEVEEVVSLVTFLLSNECRYINGSVIGLEGGLLCGSGNMKTKSKLLANLDPKYVNKQNIQQVKNELSELELKVLGI